MTPSVGGFARLRVSIATWVVLVTAKIYFAGVSRCREREAGVAAGARACVAWLRRSSCAPRPSRLSSIALTRAFTGAPAVEPDRASSRASATSPRRNGVAGAVAVRARSPSRSLPSGRRAYLRSLARGAGRAGPRRPCGCLQSDQAFRRTAARRGRREHRATEVKQHRPSYRVRSRRLAADARPDGPEGAFAWKAAMQTIRLVDRRSIMRLVGAAVRAERRSRCRSGAARGFATIVGFFASIGTAMAVLIRAAGAAHRHAAGLAASELLENLAGRTRGGRTRTTRSGRERCITACAWGLLAIALTMSGLSVHEAGLGLARLGGHKRGDRRAGVDLRAAHHSQRRRAAVSAWVPLGMQRARASTRWASASSCSGGTWLLLAIGAIPAAIGGGIVWFAFHWMIGNAALIPARAGRHGDRGD